MSVSDASAAPVLSPSLRAGLQCIQQKLRGLAGAPGVYRMLDAQGKVLYVGKARNLRASPISPAPKGTASALRA